MSSPESSDIKDSDLSTDVDTRADEPYGCIDSSTGEDPAVTSSCYVEQSQTLAHRLSMLGSSGYIKVIKTD